MSDWVGGYVLQFADRVEGQVLHRGDRESCERVVDLIPAISVSTSERPEATMLVMPAAEWDAIWEVSNQDRDPASSPEPPFGFSEEIKEEALRQYRPIAKRGGHQPSASGPPPTEPPPKPRAWDQP